MELYDVNKEKIASFIEKKKRFDFRDLLEFRKIEVEENPIKKSEGSVGRSDGKSVHSYNN